MLPGILFIIYLLLFVYSFKKFSFFNTASSWSFLSLVFAIKLCCGFAAGYIYTRIYQGGDTFTLMNDVRTVFAVLPQSPMTFFQFVFNIKSGNPELTFLYDHIYSTSSHDFFRTITDNFLIIRVNALLCLFTFGHYSLQVLFMAFLSTAGLVALYKVGAQITNSLLLKAVLFFLPSSLLWSSAVLKEPFLILCLGLNIYAFSKLLSRYSMQYLILFCISGFLFYQLKPYLFLILLPGYSAWIVSVKLRHSNSPFVFCIIYGLSFLAAHLLSLYSSINIFRVISDQQLVYYKNALYSKTGSLLPLIPFSPDAFSMLKRSPEALWIALTQPYFWNCKTMLQFFSSIENIAVLCVLLWCIVRCDYNKIKLPFLLFCIFSGISILLLMAFTTPVAGTLVRLKLPGLLLLLTGLTCSMKPISFKFLNKN